MVKTRSIIPTIIKRERENATLFCISYVENNKNFHIWNYSQTIAAFCSCHEYCKWYQTRIDCRITHIGYEPFLLITSNAIYIIVFIQSNQGVHHFLDFPFFILSLSLRSHKHIHRSQQMSIWETLHTWKILQLKIIEAWCRSSCQ